LSLATFLTVTGQSTAIEIKASRDNTMYSEGPGTLSNGRGDFIFAGTTDDGEIRRAMIWFDLSALPANLVIDSAKLVLSISKSIAGDQETSLHRITSDWGEGNSDATGQEGKGANALPGDATWEHTFYDTANWTTPGGDFIESPTETAISANTGFTLFNSEGLLADINSWIDDPESNYGWMIKVDENNVPSAKRFYSRNFSESAKRPVLTIYHQPLVSSQAFHSDENKFEMYVSPRGNDMIIESKLPAASYSLKVYSVSGTLLHDENIKLFEGKNHLENMIKTPGIHIFTLESDRERYFRKVMIL